MGQEVAVNYDFSSLEKMAGAIAKSGLFGIKDQTQAIALMLIAQSEGLHPATVAQEYHVIQGQAAIKSRAALSRFQRCGGTVKWIKRTDTECEADFSHPSGGTLKIIWTMDRAAKAGLASKDNWKKIPAQMLAARTISEGVGAVYPGCINGMYLKEEVEDFDDSPRTPDYTVDDKQTQVPPPTTTKPEVPEAEQREKFNEFLQNASVKLDGWDRIVEVVTSFGYDEIAQVPAAKFREIANAVKELLPK